MNHNTTGVSRNGNQGRPGTARPQSVSSRQGLGYPVAHVEGVREKPAATTRPSNDYASPDPRRRPSQPASAATSPARQAAALPAQAEASAAVAVASSGPITLPVELRFSCGQLAMLARCCEADGNRTVGEWIMGFMESLVAATLEEFLGGQSDDLRAMWQGKEVAL